MIVFKGALEAPYITGDTVPLCDCFADKYSIALNDPSLEDHSPFFSLGPLFPIVSSIIDTSSSSGSWRLTYHTVTSCFFTIGGISAAKRSPLGYVLEAPPKSTNCTDRHCMGGDVGRCRHGLRFGDLRLTHTKLGRPFGCDNLLKLTFVSDLVPI